MYSQPLSLRSVQVSDAFWKQEMELVRKEVIPYQWEALNDRVEGAAPSYAMRNFRVAAKKNQERRELGAAFQGFETLSEELDSLEDRFYGCVFQDSDFSKWIEAVGYSLNQHPDPELERIADGAIDLVCAAQQEDGYLDTYYIINGKNKIFTNLRDHHELYCMGHLIEGAVAYYEATGKDKLLKAAARFADYAAAHFGTEEGKKKGYPGHEIAEMALVRLYDVTGEQRYLELSKYFIEERGKRPYYFDKEHPEEVKKDTKKIFDMSTIRPICRYGSRRKRWDIRCGPYTCIPVWQTLPELPETKPCMLPARSFGTALRKKNVHYRRNWSNPYWGIIFVSL